MGVDEKREAFAKLVLEELAKAGETSAVRYEADKFQLVAGELTLNLANIFSEYENAPPEQRAEMLRSFVATRREAGTPVPKEFGEARKHLLPIVRERMWYAAVQLQFAAAQDKPLQTLFRNTGTHLTISLGYDLPNSVFELGQEHLDGWRVSFEEALAAATENLRAMTKEGWESPGRGVFISKWDDIFHPARTLLPEVFRALKLEGDPVAVVANRGAVIVAGSEDAKGLKALAGLADEGRKLPRAMSAFPIRLTGNDWTPWAPPAGHPAADAFANLRALSLLTNYAEQGELLVKLHAKQRNNVFVANLQAVREHETGRIWSVCTWTGGVRALLPKADRIAFMQLERGKGNELVAMVPWEAAAGIVGGLMKLVDLYPERFEVSAFPDAGQLEALTHAAVSMAPPRRPSLWRRIKGFFGA
ncbi:MAG: hypothetical protein HYY18_15745 [Planctomycetes bacterium]|nr:hypothetical protein [Planctomycetota bacterium]